MSNPNNVESESCSTKFLSSGQQQQQQQQQHEDQVQLQVEVPLNVLQRQEEVQVQVQAQAQAQAQAQVPIPTPTEILSGSKGSAIDQLPTYILVKLITNLQETIEKLNDRLAWLEKKDLERDVYVKELENTQKKVLEKSNIKQCINSNS